VTVSDIVSVKYQLAGKTNTSEQIRITVDVLCYHQPLRAVGYANDAGRYQNERSGVRFCTRALDGESYIDNNKTKLF
jgi:hypothetical protein